ncbi:hypothetical protein BDZ91DRAFT_765188 [Kalaharituber pfeilii]|nr:hypothetical protein BDZ91DRAFT_765188 [Kalaharituber pfeilii]
MDMGYLDFFRVILDSSYYIIVFRKYFQRGEDEYGAFRSIEWKEDGYRVFIEPKGERMDTGHLEYYVWMSENAVEWRMLCGYYIIVFIEYFQGGEDGYGVFKYIFNFNFFKDLISEFKREQIDRTFRSFKHIQVFIELSSKKKRMDRAFRSVECIQVFIEYFQGGEDGYGGFRCFECIQVFIEYFQGEKDRYGAFRSFECIQAFIESSFKGERMDTGDLDLLSDLMSDFFGVVFIVPSSKEDKIDIKYLGVYTAQGGNDRYEVFRFCVVVTTYIVFIELSSKGEEDGYEWSYYYVVVEIVMGYRTWCGTFSLGQAVILMWAGLFVNGRSLRGPASRLQWLLEASEELSVNWKIK